MHSINFKSFSEDDTIKLGIKIGNMLIKKKLPSITLLYGDIGAGKTTLIKGIGVALGIDKRDIASASFVIVSVYDTTPALCHIDLYRLQEGLDIDNIGLWDYLTADNISVIEWADRLGKDIPKESIIIRIKDLDETTREVVIEGLDEKDWNILQKS